MKKALALVACAAALSGFQTPEEQALVFQRAIHAMESRGDYEEASRLFEKAMEGPDRDRSARALFWLARCLETIDRVRALEAYDRLLREFPDSLDLVAEASKRKLGLREAPLTARRRVERAELDAFYGAVLPDGSGFISIHSSGDLGFYDPATNSTRRLTQDAPEDFSELAGHAAVSPDGSRIAYGWLLGPNRCELRVVNRDGGRGRTLFRENDVSFLRPDAWSADGKWIATLLHRRDGSKRIALVSPEDGRIGFSRDVGEEAPLETTVSPSARFVVYDRPQSPGSDDRDLFLSPTDGGAEQRLVSHPANDLWPAWTPDGRGVLFYSNRSGVFGLWLLSLTEGVPDGPPVQVRQEMGKAAPLGFTSDGAYHYALVSGTSDVYLADFDAGTARVQGQPKLLDAGYSGRNLSPSWSPDGRCLVYLSMHQELFVLPVSDRLIVACGEEELRVTRRLAPALRQLRDLRWSPDGGAFLVMGRDANDRWGLYRIDATSGEAVPVRQGSFFAPRWSPDGRAILHKTREGSGEGEVRRLVRFDLNDERETDLFRTVSPQGFVDFAPSPDGERIALTVFEVAGSANRAAILDLRSGELSDLWTAAPGADLGNYLWSADGDEILFVTGAYELSEPREMKKISASGGEPRDVGLSALGLREVAISPKWDRLAFISGSLQAANELWVLENLLPR